MKIIFDPVNMGFPLYLNKLNFLCLENHDLAYHFMRSVFLRSTKKEEDVSLYDENEKIDFSKHVDVLFSPLDLSFIRTEMRNKLYKHLEEEFFHLHYDEYQKTLSQFYQLLDMITMHSTYNLSYDDRRGLNALLSAFDVKIAEPDGSLLEKLVYYFEQVHRLLNKEVFLLFHFFHYFSEEDLHHLLQQARYEDIYLCFVEPFAPAHLSSLWNSFIVDSDLCFIYDLN